VGHGPVWTQRVWKSGEMATAVLVSVSKSSNFPANERLEQKPSEAEAVKL